MGKCVMNHREKRKNQIFNSKQSPPETKNAPEINETINRKNAHEGFAGKVV